MAACHFLDCSLGGKKRSKTYKILVLTGGRVGYNAAFLFVIICLPKIFGRASIAPTPSMITVPHPYTETNR